MNYLRNLKKLSISVKFWKFHINPSKFTPISRWPLTHISCIHKKNVQIGRGHHFDFCFWKNRPLFLSKGVLVSYFYWNTTDVCFWLPIKWVNIGSGNGSVPSIHPPRSRNLTQHYSDVIMGSIAFIQAFIQAQIKESIKAPRGIHRRPVNSPHKGPVTRKMFPFDDVIMIFSAACSQGLSGRRFWCQTHSMQCDINWLVNNLVPQRLMTFYE